MVVVIEDLYFAYFDCIFLLCLASYISLLVFAFHTKQANRTGIVRPV